MLTTGRKLLNFEVLSPLGAGGMGEVYRARDTNLGREVALKVLSGAVSDDEAVRRRFTREAHSLAALNDPHVAQIYGFHETDEMRFLSLEFVAGEDLAAWLERGPLAMDDALNICTQIAAGLQSAHRRGIVHRDLKPANVRITPAGDVKILDFGLATLAPQPPLERPTRGSSPTINAPITQHGTVLGTPAYMSPEQARGLPTDQRTDVWSFGCVLYECLSGRPAFNGQSIVDILAAILNREPDWDALSNATPVSVNSLLRACLEKDAGRRLDDFAEVRARLANTTDNEPAKGVSSALTQARDACESRNWQEAFDLLKEADQQGELEPEGLELLAECARWTGHTENICDPLERAHTLYRSRNNSRAAVRTALGLCHAYGDAGRRTIVAVWWERANELIAQLPEGPEHALHAWFQNRLCGVKGDLKGQQQHAERALELARRFADRSVEALALIDLAQVAAVRGEHAPALVLVNQAASMALGGEISIFATGVVVCNAIYCCQCRGEWQRAQEWTDWITGWVSRQHVNYFPGMCRVHRAEVLRIRGDFAGAAQECESATRLLMKAIPAYAAFPWAELGEVCRRRGDLSGALTAFQQALSLGWDPQPGLALLLLAQGEIASAHRAIELIFREPCPTSLQEDRANLLNARATIALAAKAMDVAESAAAELEAMAECNGTAWDTATATHVRGMFELAVGHAEDAVKLLTRARRIWGELEAPYEMATTCVVLGKALQADGDLSRARLELQAARDVFARIGAEFDRQKIEELLARLDDNSPRETKPMLPEVPATASMQREGDTWCFVFEGRTVRLRSTRGLEHLAVLLAHPGVDCLAIDLAGSGNAADRGDAGEILDSAARLAYKRRAEELQEELAATDAGTDPHGVERIRTELDAIGRELAAAVGLGGRPRRAGSAVERARQSVTKSIRAAIRKIAAADAVLGRYLELTVKTGTACQFDPSLRDLVEWRVEH